VLLGGPGSGKGTQAEKICAKLELPHISTGDLFRENLFSDTELGKLAKSYMNCGELVPNGVTGSMVEERLTRGDTEKGFVLDGFPRSLAQAQALAEILDRMRRRLSAVIYINLPDATIIDRLSGRLVCRQCQSPFHRQFKPPRNKDQCDNCGNELYRRDDDNPDTVSSRLKGFHAEIQPLIRYYAEVDLIHTVDGQAAPEAVHAAVMAKIQAIRSRKSA
jgi:adenylate kinase